MANFFWLLVIASVSLTQTDSVQTYTSNLCEGQPGADVAQQRLLAQRSGVAAAADTHVNVIVNVTYNGSSVRYPSVRTTGLSVIRKFVATHKARPTRSIIQTDRLCTWVYRIQKSNNKSLPLNIVQAELLVKPELHSIVLSSSAQLAWCQCIPITTDLPVLDFSSCVNGTERWEQGMQTVTVGYTCASTL